ALHHPRRPPPPAGAADDRHRRPRARPPRPGARRLREGGEAVRSDSLAAPSQATAGELAPAPAEPGRPAASGEPRDQKQVLEMQVLPPGQGIVSVHCGLISCWVLQMLLEQEKRLSMSWQSVVVMHV